MAERDMQREDDLIADQNDDDVTGIDDDEFEDDELDDEDEQDAEEAE